MPIIVPHRRGAVTQSAPSLPPPPDPVYAMMAAAQMHSEGRLLAQPTGGVEDKLNSIPEAEQTPLRTA